MVEAELGVPTKIFTSADHDGVVQGLLGATLNYAWLGTSAYAKIHLIDPEAVDVVLTKQNVGVADGDFDAGVS